MTERSGIRVATIEDAHAIACVHVASWQATYAGLMPAGYLQSLNVDQRADTWRAIFASVNSASHVWVLEVDGRIVGFIIVGATRDEPGDRATTGEVGAIYVHPGHWGRGLGRALMSAGRRSLTQAGFVQATLWVLDSNSRARAFYEADDWAPDGAVKIDDTRGFTLREVRYRRRLP